MVPKLPELTPPTHVLERGLPDCYRPTELPGDNWHSPPLVCFMSLRARAQHPRLQSDTLPGIKQEVRALRSPSNMEVPSPSFPGEMHVFCFFLFYWEGTTIS